jgi:hypothetical protein
MQPTVLTPGTFIRWAEETMKHLRSFVQRQTILSLINFTLGGIVPLAVAQGTPPPTSSTSSAAANGVPCGAGPQSLTRRQDLSAEFRNSVTRQVLVALQECGTSSPHPTSP